MSREVKYKCWSCGSYEKQSDMAAYSVTSRKSKVGVCLLCYHGNKASKNDYGKVAALGD